MKLKEAFECIRSCSCCVGVVAAIITVIIFIFGIDNYFPSPVVDVKTKEIPNLDNGQDVNMSVSYTAPLVNGEDPFSLDKIGLTRRPGKPPVGS